MVCLSVSIKSYHKVLNYKFCIAHPFTTGGHAFSSFPWPDPDRTEPPYRHGQSFPRLQLYSWNGGRQPRTLAADVHRQWPFNGWALKPQILNMIISQTLGCGVLWMIVLFVQYRLCFVVLSSWNAGYIWDQEVFPQRP